MCEGFSIGSLISGIFGGASTTGAAAGAGSGVAASAGAGATAGASITGVAGTGATVASGTGAASSGLSALQLIQYGSSVISGISAVAAYMGQNEQSAAAETAANLTRATAFEESQARAVNIDAQESEATLAAIIEEAEKQGAISASASALGLDASTLTRESNAAANEAGRDIGIEKLNSENQRLQSAFGDRASDMERETAKRRSPRASNLSLLVGLASAGGQAYGVGR